MLPSRRMSFRRRRIVYLFIAGVLGGNLASLVFNRQLWPLSPYAMFADARSVSGRTLEEVVLTGESDAGEFWFESQGYLGRMVSPIIVSAVFNDALLGGADQVQARLRETVEYYERLRATAGLKTGGANAPPLKRLNLYRFTWTMRPDLGNLRTPVRTLLATYAPGDPPIR
jgi:hypothetical protein